MTIRFQCKTKVHLVFTLALFLTSGVYSAGAQEDSINTQAVWIPDLGDGTYKNPIIYTDYSDPDIVKVEDDFYMVASSFNCIPGIPVLHSNDLVNWEIIGHILINQPPDNVYDKPGHGFGVWAPSIRYRKGEFYVYYGDPDYGIYVAKATNPEGPWKHKLLHGVRGWIDPCPFWDENDSAYLVHAYAKSRIGFNSILTLRRMSEDGETLYPQDSVMLFDGNNPAHLLKTLEGPKMYKRNGYYYVFAPYGGVAGGSQAVLRSINLNGPYDYKTVLEQGSTSINGPHQGGWVELESGESWFIHFQKKLPQGRIVHLQPVQWIDDWPFMGKDNNGNGIGEPVSTYKKPDVGQTYPIKNPQTSDDFSSANLGLQWQWHSNIDSSWFGLEENPGKLRLHAASLPSGFKNMWDVGSMLLQKLPSNEFIFQTKVNLSLQVGETAGLIVMSNVYSFIGVTKNADGIELGQMLCNKAQDGVKEQNVTKIDITNTEIYLALGMSKNGNCQFMYSFDGNDYALFGNVFKPTEGRWIGTKVGLFCRNNTGHAGNAGYADFDWVNVVDRYLKIPEQAFNPIPNLGESIQQTTSTKLSWEANLFNIEAFDIYLDTVPNPLELVKTQATTSFYARDLEVDKTYYWRVDAKNPVGISAGEVWSFRLIDETSSIQGNHRSEHMKIYPNPVLNNLIIENASEIASVHIYDLKGIFVYSLENINTNKVKITVKNLSRGLYYIKMITTDNDVINSSFVKK